jgi:serine/threonine-protein kinase
MAAPPKYRIVHQLGAGGMGTVFMGLLVGQSGFQRPLVLKQIKDDSDAEHLRLFVEEARRYAPLDHENIGRIFDFDRVDGRLCIILEYIDGWSLVEYLERHKQLGRLPDVELSVFIASRVCRGLQYVFERAAIVHRDVSPGNIMMTREGTVKLIDFGIATRSGTRESGLTGKPAYMAPEMVVELRADNRSDLFSLGTVLYEMLAGERLFKGRNTAEVLENVIAGPLPSPARCNPRVPDGVVTILRRALRRVPLSRFANAGEMGEACEHYLYDKGYGPTNLTLKQYLAGLFPEADAPLPRPADQPLEPTLLPVPARRLGPDASEEPTLMARAVEASQPGAPLPGPPDARGGRSPSGAPRRLRPRAKRS